MEKSISTYDHKIWKEMEKIILLNRHILISFFVKTLESIMSLIREGKNPGVGGHGRKICQSLEIIIAFRRC